MMLRRFGFHAQPTSLVLSFGMPLDATRAQDARNYRIVSLGGPGRGGSSVGRPIGVQSAVYNPSALTVTLRPSERLDVHNTYRLVVKGTAPSGLAGPTGVPFGRNSVGLISRSTLAGPAPTSLPNPLGRRAGFPQGAARLSARGANALSARRPGSAFGPRFQRPGLGS
jgi:type VI secretion system secreted protein VgrG